MREYMLLVEKESRPVRVSDIFDMDGWGVDLNSNVGRCGNRSGINKGSVYSVWYVVSRIGVDFGCVETIEARKSTTAGWIDGPQGWIPGQRIMAQ